MQEIMELMNKGNLYRTTEATNCNEVSSRSHAVLQVRRRRRVRRAAIWKHRRTCMCMCMCTHVHVHVHVHVRMSAPCVVWCSRHGPTAV